MEKCEFTKTRSFTGPQELKAEGPLPNKMYANADILFRKRVVEQSDPHLFRGTEGDSGRGERLQVSEHRARLCGEGVL